MNYIELQCEITPLSEEIAEILIAELSEIEFESFTQSENTVFAYIQEPLFCCENVKELTVNMLPNFQIKYSQKVIESQDWNAVWESNFKPVIIADKVVIRASFHTDTPAVPFDIVIDPKMSFGTGHHSTTSLMVQQILETPVANKNVLDMGCGTSILAILASKIGAQHIDAIDIDEWPYHNSLENIKNNKADNIDVFLGDASLLEDKHYDIVFANINRNILLNDMHHYTACLPQNGTLIMSGFYTEDLQMIQNKAESLGLTYINHKVDNNWVAAKFQKQ